VGAIFAQSLKLLPMKKKKSDAKKSKRLKKSFKKQDQRTVADCPKRNE